MGLYVARLVEKCIKMLIGKSEGKNPIGRPRRRWKINIQVNIKEIG
jgi:hypothetical protein